MKVALFIPCYVDQFYPNVGIATYSLLKKLGCEIVYPEGQTCCGQPLANSGLERKAIPVYEHFIDTFSEFEHVVTPSASCAYHVKHHYDIVSDHSNCAGVRKNIIDLTEFLVDIFKLEKLPARFPHKVGLHQSCHGLRGFRTAMGSERNVTGFSKWNYLLSMVDGIELISLDKPDECCGFGGTFSVKEEKISVKMGYDRIHDHLSKGAEYITSGDMSCLMHLEGIIRRNRINIGVIHLSEILNSDL